MADLLLGIGVDRAIELPAGGQLQGDQQQEAKRGRQGPAAEGEVARPEAITALMEVSRQVGEQGTQQSQRTVVDQVLDQAQLPVGIQEFWGARRIPALPPERSPRAPAKGPPKQRPDLDRCFWRLDVDDVRRGGAMFQLRAAAMKAIALKEIGSAEKMNPIC